MSDLELESSPNPKRVAAARAYHERRQEKALAETQQLNEVWFELVGNTKVVKRTKTAHGHVHSVYIGTKKQAESQGIKYKVA